MRLYDYAASCNCYKVRLLLAHLRRPYERVPVDIFNGETLTDEFARMNPSRTTPVLETDDGRFLPESNAILVYLAQGTEYLPDDPFERAEVVRWLVYEQTDVIPTVDGLRFRLLVGRLTPSDPDAMRRKEGGEEVLRLLDEHLAERVLRRRPLHDRRHRDLRLHASRARGRNRHGALCAAPRLVRAGGAAARLRRGRGAIRRERGSRRGALALRLSRNTAGGRGVSTNARGSRLLGVPAPLRTEGCETN
jgi:glutathione S-transferase